MVLLVFYSLLLLLAKPIQAQQILFSDNFDDGNFDDWTIVRNQQLHHPEKPCFNGIHLAQWEITAGKLGITLDGNPCVTELLPHNLDLTAVDNFEFEFDWYFPTSIHMDRNVLIMWQDADNWYDLHVFDEKIIIQKVINGKLVSLYDNWGEFSFAANNNYHFKITVADQFISVWIDDQQIIKTLDQPPLLIGPITLGLQASMGSVSHSASYFDNLIVYSQPQLDGKKLKVPLFKQSDSSWKNHEYDHAQTWSKKYTIRRWGCALTSAAMILNYHGIDQLPNGRTLDPAKLNAWLKNQPDGYIGQGLLNWIAITRLTKLMNSQLETPTLEYSWSKGSIISVIKKIDQDQPVVLQLPGHFLVAAGYTPDKTDLHIKDPAYSYNLFSRHQTEMLSMRSFTPSQTDLSYLLLVHEPEIEVTLIDQSEQIPLELNIYTEYIQDPESDLDEKTKVMVIQSLAKPIIGKYRIEINNRSGLDKLVEIYSYDIEGEVAVLSQEVLGSKLFNLNFNPTGESQLTEETNKFTLLRRLLKTLYESNEIKVRYAYLKLDRLAAFGEKNLENQQRYQDLIIKTAQELKDFLPYLTVILSLSPSS